MHVYMQKRQMHTHTKAVGEGKLRCVHLLQCARFDNITAVPATEQPQVEVIPEFSSITCFETGCQKKG